MAQYWFIRHGESVAQVSTWPGDDPEVPLSPRGVEQARALAKGVSALPIERVLCSPFVRARETARHLLADSRHEPTFVSDLRERFAGEWSKIFHRDAAMQAQLAQWEFRPPNGESVRDAALRGLRALAEHEREAHTLVVAHGRILAGVLTLLDGRDWCKGVKSLENCVLAQREVAPNTWARLVENLEER
jgi:alpha-ribazole phosphatase